MGSCIIATPNSSCIPPMASSGSIETIQVHGLPALALTSRDGARAVVSPFGAQVLSWRPAGGREWLYLSEQARFDGSTPIRGGIPVCFPQFAGQGPLPKHGFARTRDWALGEQRQEQDYTLACLRLTPTPAELAAWPHPYEAELTLSLGGNRLDLELEVRNPGDTPLSFTAALHTYLRVAEVEEATLAGLHGLHYADSTAQGRVIRETGDLLRVDREVDRIYRNTTRPLLLQDGNRALGIQVEGFTDVVVWNPWEDKCAALADMPPNGFRHMLCVEAAAAAQPVALDPGQEWWGRQTLVAL